MVGNTRLQGQIFEQESATSSGQMPHLWSPQDLGVIFSNPPQANHPEKGSMISGHFPHISSKPAETLTENQNRFETNRKCAYTSLTHISCQHGGGGDPGAALMHMPETVHAKTHVYLTKFIQVLASRLVLDVPLLVGHPVRGKTERLQINIWKTLWTLPARDQELWGEKCLDCPLGRPQKQCYWVVFCPMVYMYGWNEH